MELISLRAPYLEKIEAAGSWAAYEKAHRAQTVGDLRAESSRTS